MEPEHPHGDMKDLPSPIRVFTLVSLQAICEMIIPKATHSLAQACLR